MTTTPDTTPCPHCAGWPGEADGSCPCCVERLGIIVHRDALLAACREAPRLFELGVTAGSFGEYEITRARANEARRKAKEIESLIEAAIAWGEKEQP